MSLSVEYRGKTEEFVVESVLPRYVQLPDGTVWDREALWQELERVLKRRRPGPGRPASGGAGSGAGLTDERVWSVWELLESFRTGRLKAFPTDDEGVTAGIVKASKVVRGSPSPVSKAAVARGLYISRIVLWRYWGGKHQRPWPPRKPDTNRE